MGSRWVIYLIMRLNIIVNDGQLVFVSNQDAAAEGDTNVFVADWVD